MRNTAKVFLFGFLCTVLAASSASAQESGSWIQKVKGFFKSSAAEQMRPAAEADEQAEIAAPEKKTPVFDFSEKTIGNREAPLKINIFTSLTCPHCAGIHTRLLPYIKEKYADTNQALIILNDFPLEPRAMTASTVARCLNGDNYFAFVDTLFEKQKVWAVAPDVTEALLPYAKLAGLGEDDVRSCAKDKAAAKELTRQRNLAIMRYKIHATPTLILQLGKETERFEGAPNQKDVDEAIEKLKEKYTGSWPSATETAKPEPSAP